MRMFLPFVTIYQATLNLFTRLTDYNTYCSPLCRLAFKLCGWKAVGRLPDGVPKFVMIAAPHTSNWDFVIMLATTSALGFKLKWMAKRSIFIWPFRSILKWIGGLPIDRKEKHDTVSQVVQYFNNAENLIVSVPPEGTRKKEKFWKSGFYFIAHTAQVPLVCGFIDYKTKQAGLGPTIHLTGDIKKDMDKVRSFYKTITPKFPEQQSEIKLQQE